MMSKYTVSIGRNVIQKINLQYFQLDFISFCKYEKCDLQNLVKMSQGKSDAQEFGISLKNVTNNNM